MNEQIGIGDYLIQRLLDHGVRHMFCVPGDYVLGFMARAQDSPLKLINTCDEQGAGFAADAYARLNGLGCVCVTYCVGGLKIANTTAQAYAEKSPVVVITGSPGVGERARNPLLHHKVRDFDTQAKVFEQLTVEAAVLDDVETAFRRIDRALEAAVRFKRPVYLELPRDMVCAMSTAPPAAPVKDEGSDPDALSEALREACAMIGAAARPVVVAGVELHRFGLQDDLVRFAEATNFPVASTILGKSAMAERHPNYIGLYEGGMGRDDVREYVEGSDCLIMLGAMLGDIDLGIFTARLNPDVTIYCTTERTSIRHHVYEDIRLEDFLHGLLDAGLERRGPSGGPRPQPPAPFEPLPGKPVSVSRLFQRIDAFIDDDTVVIADPGDALFGGEDLTIHGGAQFLSPAYYTSLGFAVPAALGAQLANPRGRPLVLVGDGAFQMTGMELSTIARFGLNPIVLVLNNRGYGTERPMADGSFNDVLNWRYSRIPDLLGAGRGWEVCTEDELDAALDEARRYTEGFSILDVHLDPKDCSAALGRLTAALAAKVKSASG